MTNTADNHFSEEYFMQSLLEPGSFSFLRMGDGELRFLLECQKGVRSDESYRAQTSSGLSTFVKGAAAIKVADYNKILWSYENCTVVDWYSNQKYNRKHLSELALNRPDRSRDIVDEETCVFLVPWVFHNLRKLVERRRCLFCAAEAPLQAALLRDSEYRRIARNLWGDVREVHFMNLPDNGLNLSRDYEKILELLISEVQQKQIDILFLGASGLAKPLCLEIANRCAIKAIDMGSLLRATTYSATSGPYGWRANHNPFYFRVPLKVYYTALQETYPDLDMETFAVKATAQLCLDLCRKKKCADHNPSDLHDPSVIDLSNPNWDTFLENYQYFQKNLRPHFLSVPAGRDKVREFNIWLRRHGIFPRHRFMNSIKSLVKSMLGITPRESNG